MEYTKNTDPNFYIDKQPGTNCGSFAFNIKEWYNPEDSFLTSIDNMYDWIQEMHDGGYSSDELADIYAEALIEKIFQDFGADVREVYNLSDITSDEELIAFRGWCYYDDMDEDNWSDWDFHFKVLRDGMWQEKCGSGPVRFCLEDEWSYGFRTYNSETIYIAHKIN